MAATFSSLVGLAVGGKYEIRRVLGVGGMGVVCEAIHVDLGKKVAIKLIDKTMKESELIVARFRREARALGQIQSEHIVDVFDVGADARVGLYMVMEHLPGEDLQTRLEREKRLDLTAGVMVAHQMARGLEKAHAAGVIHRDLKPANVFLTTRDNGSLLVKLLDFGVSKVLNEVGGARITGAGAPIGTPLYMSPEQAEGKDDTDGRADIWSLGAVLYEALSGTAPFPDRGSYHGTIVGILTSRPKLLHDAAPWVPAELAKVVDAMLVHDRDARIKDAASVTKRLLEAFPAVLPDGTGRHTAVIVPTAHAVDATGDTEIFTSSGFQAAQRTSAPGSGRASAPGSSQRGIPDEEDSKRTVPNVTSSPGVSPGASGDATRTAAATPIEMGRGESATIPPLSEEAQISSKPVVSGVVSGVSIKTPEPSAKKAGPKTDPMPWLTSPSSSASGVAMPGTPPLIDPLPLGPGDIAPDTQRDTSLAVRAERRRWLMLGAIAIIVVAGAIGGYLAGRRASPPTNVASPSAPTAQVTTATATTATATAATQPVASPSAITSAAPATSGVVAAPSATTAGAAMGGDSVTPVAKPRKRPIVRAKPTATLEEEPAPPLVPPTAAPSVPPSVPPPAPPPAPTTNPIF